METPPNPLIKSKHNDNSDKDFVKLKFLRDSTSATLDIYEFNMDLFDNGDPEEFLFFVQKFNMTLAASETLETGANVYYICSPVCG